MDNRRDYYLLLADIKGSSDLTAQANTALMARLIPALEAQNDAHSADLAYPLEINYGDEFAGLFSNPRAIYQIVTTIRAALRGLASFRFVVAHGRIGFAGQTIREMGGPVFDTAASALSDLKKKKSFARWIMGQNTTRLSLDALTNGAHSLLQDMTDYQYDVFRLQSAGLKGVEIAKALSKDPRSVSNAKKTGHAKTAIALEQAIHSILALEAHQGADNGD